MHGASTCYRVIRYTQAMPSFPYVARTIEGTLEQGSVEASSVENARAELHKRGLTIEELDGDDTASFNEEPLWTSPDTMPVRAAKVATPAIGDVSYIPLTQTLRLFAGWLMAWYGIIYLAGRYRADGRLPWDIPAIQGLSESTLVLRFAFAVFLFLLFSDIQKWTGKGALKAVMLGVVGAFLFVVFHLNV